MSVVEYSFLYTSAAFSVIAFFVSFFALRSASEIKASAHRALRLAEDAYKFAREANQAALQGGGTAPEREKEKDREKDKKKTIRAARDVRDEARNAIRDVPPVSVADHADEAVSAIDHVRKIVGKIQLECCADLDAKGNYLGSHVMPPDSNRSMLIQKAVDSAPPQYRLSLKQAVAPIWEVKGSDRYYSLQVRAAFEEARWSLEELKKSILEHTPGRNAEMPAQDDRKTAINQLKRAIFQMNKRFNPNFPNPKPGKVIYWDNAQNRALIDTAIDKSPDDLKESLREVLSPIINDIEKDKIYIPTQFQAIFSQAIARLDEMENAAVES